MTPENIVSRDQWLDARRNLLAREKALTKERDAITASRQALPWVQLEKTYVFETDTGETTLPELFGDHSQLIVYHFMFGPEWREGCVSCSFWADSFNGIEPHLNQRDIAFVAVSRAPMSKIAPFKKRMGWTFNWVSSHGNSFNADFNVSFGSDHKPEEPVFYNFREDGFSPMDEAHGTSVLAKGDDGAIYHTYSTYGRGLDITNAAYSYIDLTPKGRGATPRAGIGGQPHGADEWVFDPSRPVLMHGREWRPGPLKCR